MHALGVVTTDHKVLFVQSLDGIIRNFMSEAGQVLFVNTETMRWRFHILAIYEWWLAARVKITKCKIYYVSTHSISKRLITHKH